MKSSAVHLLLFVLCFSSNRNIVEGIFFNGLFDYFYEYFDSSSEEEDAVDVEALNELIMKLCGNSTKKPGENGESKPDMAKPDDSMMPPPMNDAMMPPAMDDAMMPPAMGGMDAPADPPPGDMGETAADPPPEGMMR